jgi:tetratricopeptide (TPR) repeat protein
MPEQQMRDGFLRENGFPELLRGLVRQLAVGRLEVSREGVTRRLWLEDGQVRAVVSDIEEEKLGSWLVAHGRLQGAQMAVALLRQPGGVRFGTYLVQEGLLSLEQLVAELGALAAKIISRMLFDRAAYAFVPGERWPRDAASLELTTASLLMGAVRVADETAPLSALIQPHVYVWPAQDAILEYQSVRLTPQEGYLLSRIDGQTTVATLGRLVPIPGNAVATALAGLVIAGVAEVHPGTMPRRDEAAAPPAPARSATAPVVASQPPVLRPRTSPPAAAPSVPNPSWSDTAPRTSPTAPPVFRTLAGAPPPPSSPVSVPVAEPARADRSSDGFDFHEIAASDPDEGLEFTPEQMSEHADVLDFARRCRHLDPYARLGLPPQAKQELVLPHFRELVRQYHPDRADEPHLKMLRGELAEISTALVEALDAITAINKAAGPVILSPGSGALETLTDEMRRQQVHEKVNQARRLLRQGDANQAAELLDQAVRLAPDPKTLLFLAKVEFHNPIWVQRGLDRLRHAVSMDPQFTEGWLELANYWGTRGQPDKQRQCLEKILAYDPRNEDVRSNLTSISLARPTRRR